ncbi:MAG: Alkaline phosphatase synthesis transcriptional regulatory protein PhoP [Smithella sp. PtaU1.Bin162]|nr:MAG: Alkaline phosphatase synthesis transcriptional regulatory protein PhoP [Smithella sp. PtaU1.Bin162]
MSKILVVDDDHDILKLLRFKLSQEGYKVIVAVDAYNGIQTANREKPDLIILDIMMPAGGGYHTLKNIRLTSHGSQIPIVVLTGMQDPELKKKIEAEGVEAYMQKPLDYPVLSETIKKLLSA